MMEDNAHSELVYTHIEYINEPFIVISGPSAGGKTTLAEESSYYFSEILMLLIKHTDRLPRNGEINGREYFFIEPDKFDSLITKNNSLIKVTRYNHKYALCSSQVDISIRLKKRPLFILDPHAALMFKKQYPNSLLLFVAPKLVSTVENRIRARNEDSVEKEKRIALLNEEYELRQKFDYNVFFDEGIDVIRKILFSAQ